MDDHSHKHVLNDVLIVVQDKNDHFRYRQRSCCAQTSTRNNWVHAKRMDQRVIRVEPLEVMILEVNHGMSFLLTWRILICPCASLLEV
jgi:hypothetical protein